MLPGQWSLQRGGDCLPGEEVLGDLEVGGEGEPLVDLLLVGQLPPARLLPELDEGGVVGDSAHPAAGHHARHAHPGPGHRAQVLGAGRHVRILRGPGALFRLSVGADSWMLVNNTCNVNREH